MSADEQRGSIVSVSLGSNDIANAIALLTAIADESRPDEDRVEHLQQRVQTGNDPWHRRRATLKKKTGLCRIILEALVLLASVLRLLTSVLLEVLVLAASILRLVTSMTLEVLVLTASLLRLVSATLSSGLLFTSDIVVLIFDCISVLASNVKGLVK